MDSRCRVLRFGSRGARVRGALVAHVLRLVRELDVRNVHRAGVRDGGIGLGSVIGGRIAERLGSPVRAYGLAEMLIGITGWRVPRGVRLAEPLIASLYAEPRMAGHLLVLARVAIALAVLDKLRISRTTSSRDSTVGNRTGRFARTTSSSQSISTPSTLR